MTTGLKHRKAKRLLGELAALVVLASVVSMAAAQPKPTLEYVFNSSTDSLSKPGGVMDHSGNKYDGSDELSGTEASFVPGHTPLNASVSQGTAVLFLGDDDPNGTDAEPGTGTGIDTGIDTDAGGDSTPAPSP